MSFTQQKPTRRSPLPLVLTVLGIAAVLFGLYQNQQTQRKELIAVWAREVPAGTQVTPDDVGTIAVAVDRVPQLAGVANPATLVGSWTTRTVGKDEVVNLTQVSALPPTRPMYPNGKALPQGLVPIPFATATIGYVTDRDTVNIGFTDPSGDQARCREIGGQPAADPVAAIPAEAAGAPASAAAMGANGAPIPYTCMLLTRLEVLHVDAANGTVFLAGTPYQSQALWTVSAIEGVSLFGQRYSADSEPLPVSGRMEPQHIDPAGLSGAYTTTNQLLPGVRTVIPGAVVPSGADADGSK